MNVQRFPHATDEQPFWEHLQSKTIISAQNYVFQETWTMNMQSNPQCHQQLTISRPSLKYNFTNTKS